MYAQAVLIWGIRLNEEAAEVTEGLADEHGFEVLYSGNSDYEPGYLGIELGEIDTCQDIKLSDIEKLKSGKKITETAKKNVIKKIESLDEEIKRCYTEEELKPDFWIIWYTS